MPSEETRGLLTVCFLERNDPREILISKDNKLLNDLPPDSVIGTSSFRREYQIKKIRKVMPKFYVKKRNHQHHHKKSR